MYSMGMEPSAVGGELVGGALRFRLVSGCFLCRCHRGLLSLTSPAWVTVVNGAFASLVVSVWA